LKIPLYKKLISYFHPVWIRGATKTDSNPELELLLYRGRWQLATNDAIYSDGDKYTPIIVAYKALNQKLAAIKNVLVLGAALGSAVDIMGKKGYSPDFILVDNDALVLEWANELMRPYAGAIELKQADAEYYLDSDDEKYDLLIVDVFVGRVVPGFITTESFMRNCRLHIHTGGSFVLNYILHEGEEWEQFKNIFESVFPQSRIIKNGINRIMIATV
jgi:predicted membrane-bound spermidine synthase